MSAQNIVRRRRDLSFSHRRGRSHLLLRIVS
jgi:hypothetical protein